jgi:hypothetical protein
VNDGWRLAASLTLAAAAAVCAAPASGTPSAQSVGDCWISSQKIDAANAFYRRVKQRGGRACDREGTACDVLASQELRRIDCGAAWPAPTAEAAWQGFLAALGDQRGQAASSHLYPDVRAWSDRDAMLSERCPAETFAVPAALKAQRERIAKSIGGDSRPWEIRSVTVPLAAGDRPWKNYSPDVYRFIAIRACRATRPVAGGRAGGYFIDLVPLETENAPGEIACSDG